MHTNTMTIVGVGSRDEGGAAVTSDTQARWDSLLLTSKRVLEAFRNGRNPTFEQLDKLEAAIEGIEVQKICGHRVIEECECEEPPHAE